MCQVKTGLSRKLRPVETGPLTCQSLIAVFMYWQDEKCNYFATAKSIDDLLF